MNASESWHGREREMLGLCDYQILSIMLLHGTSLQCNPLIGIPKPSPGIGHGPGSCKLQIDKYHAYWLVGFKELIGNPELPAGSWAFDRLRHSLLG